MVVYVLEEMSGHGSWEIWISEDVIMTIETDLWDIQVEIFILDPGMSMQDDTNFVISDMWGHGTEIWHRNTTSQFVYQ